jgi:hypothetical protein
VSFEGLFPVKKEAIGVVGLVDFGYQLFTNTHHLGVEVPNPVHLDGFVWE